MVMIELDSPLPHDDALKKLWSNTPKEPGDPRDPTHPTEIMGALTNVTSEVPSGRVYNIVLEGEYRGVYSEFHKTLQAAIAAHDYVEPISAINVSLNVSTRLDLPHQAMDVMEELKRDIDMLSRKGIAVVISAGNDGKGHILNEQGKFLNTLASIDPRIIVVGSSVQTVETDGIYSTSQINTDWAVSGFSGSGTDHYRPDLVAPGENILVEDEFGEQSRISGTSLSAPYVTRLIVKMKEENPHLSVEMIQAILKMTAEDIDSSTYYSEGAGHIQPVECLYVAYAMNPLHTAKQKDKKATQLGLSSNKNNLDRLVQWIRWQVWLTDTNRQSYGE